MLQLLLAGLLSAAAVQGGPPPVWTATTPLPDGYSHHRLVAGPDCLYSIGGMSLNNGVTDGHRVFAAQVQPDGNLGAWTETTPLPEPVFVHSAVAAGGFLYVLAGWHFVNVSVVSDVVYVAPIASGGTVGAWSATTPLPQRLILQDATVWNGTIFVIGGWNESIQELSDVVYSAAIQPNGTLSPWRTERSLPSAVYAHAAVSDGSLYVLGGAINGGSQIHSGVWTAHINPDSTLQPWVVTTPLSQPLGEHAAAVASGRVYVLGGWTGFGPTADVTSASTEAQGLAVWAQEPPLPNLLAWLAAAVFGGRLYVSGGVDSVEIQSEVYWLPLPPVDECPNDPNKTAPGQCGCGNPDTDSDADGTADCVDGCPLDAAKIAPGQCGCGVADTDTDGDGFADCLDNCIAIANPTQADCDLDGIGDACEIAAGAPDLNANGIPDSCELGVSLPYCTAGTTSHGCVPSISGAGTPSASAGSGFTIAVADVEGAPSGLGNPVVGGETVWAQGWFRDPPSPKTTNLSNGLMFTVQP